MRDVTAVIGHLAGGSVVVSEEIRTDSEPVARSDQKGEPDPDSALLQRLGGSEATLELGGLVNVVLLSQVNKVEGLKPDM
ncbi:unnamed protein product [Lota lota]